MTIPTLKTDRLILRPPGLQHFDYSLRLWGDPQVARFTGGTPRDAEDIWNRLLKKAGQWALFGYGAWIAERRSDGKEIGEAGFMLNQRLLDPPATQGWPQDPEIGWAFLPEAQGQGFASEAVRAAIAWGDDQGFERTICLIDRDNAASLSLAGKAGYIEYDRCGLHGHAAALLERRRPS